MLKVRSIRRRHTLLTAYSRLVQRVWLLQSASSLAALPVTCSSTTKWARTNPPQKAAGYLNPGWPGCCRPPAPSEHRMIQAADWRSVSIVHHIPIPPDIKATLDGLRPGGSPAAPPRGPPKSPAPDRKGSPPSKTAAMPPKSPAISIPPKSRGSPKQGTASLSNSLSRSTPPRTSLQRPRLPAPPLPAAIPALPVHPYQLSGLPIAPLPINH